MDNLDKAFEGLKLEDVQISLNEGTSNLIEPTEAEIGLIRQALLDGKDYKEIKKTIRRVEKDGETQVSAKGFSHAQIHEIKLAMEAKVAELSPKEEEI
uniref:Uncharacterized protein n=1 Tax=viral metagenome TaxID=1070528 RepID=A0A6M3Y6L6_9ZZZZ